MIVSILTLEEGVLVPKTKPTTQYQCDLMVTCRTCGAGEGKPCKDLRRDKVHFGRRLAALLAGCRLEEVRKAFDSEK